LIDKINISIDYIGFTVELDCIDCSILTLIFNDIENTVIIEYII